MTLNLCNLKIRSTFVIIWIINFLFLYKYAQRIDFVVAILSVVAYTLFVGYISFCFFYAQIKIRLEFLIFLTGLYFLIHIIVFFLLPKESLNVDRWSVISSFWDYAFSGNYPYYAKSFANNYPGPMPFYFYLALPFYLIGELGIFSMVGLLITIYFFFRHKNKEEFSYVLLLLLSSAGIFWEICTRSATLINAILILMLIYHIGDINKFSVNKFWITAILGGLFLSMRGIFVLVFIIWGIYILKNKIIPFSKLFQWGIIFLISFIFTFLPIIIFFYDDFFIMNPFIVQSSFLLPSSFIPFLFILAIIGGLLCKNSLDVIYYSSLVLFISIAIYFCYHAFLDGITNAYLNNMIDISYFIFTYPFALFILATKLKKDDREQGDNSGITRL